MNYKNYKYSKIKHYYVNRPVYPKTLDVRNEMEKMNKKGRNIVYNKMFFAEILIAATEYLILLFIPGSRAPKYCSTSDACSFPIHWAQPES